MFKLFYVRLFLSIVTIAIVMTGCKKEVTGVKLPQVNPELVVGCFFSPQDTILVLTLSRSNPVFGTDHNLLTLVNSLVIPDASVILSDGTNSATLTYNFSHYQYELKASLFPIMSGKTYYLNVSTPKGENVSASCTVPLSNLSSFTVDFVDTASERKVINVKWNDIPSQTNYYRVFGQLVVQDGEEKDTSYNNMRSSVTNDAGRDGQEMSLEMQVRYDMTQTDNGVKYTDVLIGYDVYLLNIDAEYYNYQYSLDHYSGDDPFAEPSPLYTNINGGLGVFGAYQKLYVRKK